ncbi:eukaryotic and archaeal DNA primase, large subunit-domain-containing protein [Pelagophyceae sp. CCMP2097]|nr:eukaryotic and archaeal DNA primase, large subunit-domain-containing protein [Pelagophyceae sp. CCMP2097]
MADAQRRCDADFLDYVARKGSPHMQLFAKHYAERFVPPIDLWDDVVVDSNETWAYAAPPSDPVSVDAYEAHSRQRLDVYIGAAGDFDAADDDAWSHWTIRHACAMVRDADERHIVWKWFLKNEVELFSRRCASQTSEQLARFVGAETATADDVSRLMRGASPPRGGAAPMHDEPTRDGLLQRCPSQFAPAKTAQPSDGFSAAVSLAALPEDLQGTSSLHEDSLVKDAFAEARAALGTFVSSPHEMYVLRDPYLGDVAGALKSRRVLLVRGSVVVRAPQLARIAKAKFGRHVKLALRECAENWFSTDPAAVPRRTRDHFEHLSSAVRAAAQSDAARGGAHRQPGSVVPFPILESELDSRLLPHFPPCMAQKHWQLRQRRGGPGHLKHVTRFGYNLFLKAIGVPLEQVEVLWRKEHPYRDFQNNIRHAFGRSGARKDYSPYSCASFIKHSRSLEDTVGGCPFALDDEKNISEILDGLGCGPARAQDVVRGLDREPAAVKNARAPQRCVHAFNAAHASAGGARQASDFGTATNWFVQSFKARQREAA